MLSKEKFDKPATVFASEEHNGLFYEIHILGGHAK